MKALCSLAFSVAALALPLSSAAQGTIVFNNLANNNSAMMATSRGLVFLQGADGVVRPLNQDLNFELFGGPAPLGPMPLLNRWLVADGSATGIGTGNGHFADPSRGIYWVPGVPLYGTAMFELRVWTGTYTNFFEAMSSRDSLGTGVFFENPTGGPDQAASLTGMPAVVLAIPEPSMLSFVVTGAIAFLLLRRRSWRQNEQGRERASS